MVDKFGSQLIEFAPGHLRVMAMKTLPSEVESEMLDKPELKTWEQIIEHCRRKFAYKNQKLLASYIKPGTTRITSIQRQEDSDDDDEEEISQKKRQD